MLHEDLSKLEQAFQSEKLNKMREIGKLNSEIEELKKLLQNYKEEEKMLQSL